MEYNIKFNEYCVKENFTEIYVTQRDKTRHTIFISNNKLDKLLNFGHKWHVRWHKNIRGYYAHVTVYSKDGSEDVTMHSFLFGKKDGQVIDHINNNGLDNQDENIRPCLENKNLQNRKGRNSNNKTGYRNVILSRGFYRVQLQINGKNHKFEERFTDVHEAGRFAEQKRKEIYGEFSGNN